MKKNKTKKMAVSNTSNTGLLQFESIDITELQSCKNQAIEDYYKSDNTEWEKRVYKQIIEDIENHLLKYSSSYYMLNDFTLPDGSKDIKSFKSEVETHNHNSIDIGIEGWDELELKIGVKEVTFHNMQSNKSIDRYLGKLKWEKNLQIEVLRVFGETSILKRLHFIRESKHAKTPEWQSIKNAVQDVKNDLRSLFPDLPDNPIEYDWKGKGYATPIKVTLLDSDEYVINMNEHLQHKAIEEIGTTFEREFDEGRRESAHYDDQYEVFDEDNDI